MKSRSTALQAAQQGPATRPAMLVEIGFPTPVRWSSGTAVDWGGFTWAPFDVQVLNLRVAAFQVSGTLVLGNADGQAAALVLDAGVQDRPIRIWTFDRAATAAGDFVWLCSASAGAAQVTAREVRISLRHRTEFMQSPRVFVTPAAGFNHLVPAGTVLRINGLDFTLERGQ